MKNPKSGMSRRTFLKSVAGAAIMINILPLASCQVADNSFNENSSQIAASSPVKQSTSGNSGWMGAPGKANYRIDGLAKVTGQKVYARDYHAKDMPGWPGSELLAMIIRAIDVEHVFMGLDLSFLPPEFSPSRIIYSEMLDDTIVLTNNIGHDLDLDHIEDELRQSIKLPHDIKYPFIVPREKLADFYGQPVAFLIFPSRSAFLGAKKRLQFNTDIQKYGIEKTHESVGKPVQPITNYVRVAGEGNNHDVFSYVLNGKNRKEYNPQADKYRKDIQNEIDSSNWNVYSSKFSMEAMDPMFMEPEAGIAWYDADTLTLNLVLGTQSPDGDIKEAISMFKDSESKIQIETVNLYSCYPGGGFGGRDKSMFTMNLIVAAAFAGGQPVRLAYDRFEQFQAGFKRHACKGNEQLAFDNSGKLQAMVTNMEFDSGGRKNLSPYVAQLAALCAGGSYVIPKSAIHSQAVYSQNISGGSQRGFGGPQAFFIIESLMDEAAADLGMDPFSIRRANLLTKGDKTVVGGPINQSLRLHDILDRAESHSLWQNRAADQAQWKEKGLSYGVGFAMSIQAYGTSGDGVIGYVGIDEQGRLEVKTNAVDMGNGSATTLAVVPASVLGSNASSIEMGNANLFTQLDMNTDRKKSWDSHDWTPKGVGSSSACLTALHQVHAVVQASQVLFDTAIFPAAKEIWGEEASSLKSDQVTWQDEQLVALDGRFNPLTLQAISKHIYANNRVRAALVHAFFQGSWAEATFAINGTQTWQIDGLGLYRAGSSDISLYRRQSVKHPDDDARRYSRTVFAPCGNLIALTVDPNTGNVKIRASVSVLNAGKIITEGLVSGQSQGGVAMAIGYTLLESTPPGLEGPAKGDWNLHRYHVPLAGDVAWENQELITLEPEEGETTARGIAEAVMCSVAPAISNALFDATDKRFRDLPITSEKIKEALHDSN